MSVQKMLFKRGNKDILELRLVDTNKPLEGEPIFELDTGKLKIGDGVNNYKDLPYVGNGSSPEPEDSDILLRGYFKESEGRFYPTPESTDPLPKLRRKLYLDIPTNRIFAYVVAQGESVLDGRFVACITYATSDNAGIVKMYNVLGNNTDGTMTQKAITDSIGTIDFDVETIDEENCLVLNRPNIQQ